MSVQTDIQRLDREAENLAKGLASVGKLLETITSQVNRLQATMDQEREQSKRIYNFLQGGDDFGKESLSTKIILLDRRLTDVEKNQSVVSARWWQIVVALLTGSVGAFFLGKLLN